MKYVLGDPPRGQSEAFEVLENVFSAEEFTQAEAQEVLEETLDMSSSEARNELRRLMRSGAIEEA